MEEVDFLLAIVAHRALTAPTAHSLWNFCKSSPIASHTELGLFVGDALISRGRSQACSKFLDESKYSYMLFIDDDIAFKNEDVEKIYSYLASGNYDVIGGVYPVRGASQLSSYGWGGTMPANAGVLEIEYLATGFMGISRRILEKIRTELKLPLLNPNDWAKCYPFFEDGRFEVRTKGGDPIFISEDWDFCEKVRKVGGKIYADTTIKLGHMREYLFTPDDVVEIQYKDEMQKRIYGPINHQLDLMRSVDTDLGEFFGQTPKRVRERMVVAQNELRKMWLEKTCSTEEFYQGNTEELYDLATFNMQPVYREQRVSSLFNIAQQKILDIGCGIGFTSFMMAEQGNEVLGWDINKKCIEFCKLRKKKYNLGGEFTTEKPDFSPFNLIIAIDTFEHIENLKEFLADLGKQVKRGSKLYHTEYWARDKSWPQHFEEHKEHFSGWLRKGGWVEWDERWAIKA